MNVVLKTVFPLGFQEVSSGTCRNILIFEGIPVRPGVDSGSNRNEYQEYFLGVKAAGA